MRVKQTAGEGKKKEKKKRETGLFSTYYSNIFSSQINKSTP